MLNGMNAIEIQFTDSQNRSERREKIKMNLKKTQKNNKNIYTHKDKLKLWKSFTHGCLSDNLSGFDKKQDVEERQTLDERIIIESIENNDLCYSCNSILVVAEDGFPTCTNNACAIIYNHSLDYSPEWRYFDASDKTGGADPTRCGNPINPLLKESSFSCKVLCGNNASFEMKKIKKWTEWQSTPHKEKALYDEFQFITTMAQNAGISKIFIDEAMAIHKDISEQKMFRGLNRDGIKSASIYISCRRNGSPRTAHEIAEIFSLDKYSATKGCSLAIDILNNIERGNDTLHPSSSHQIDFCNTTPSSFIERFCSKLGMNQELIILAKFIADKIERERIITDNTPHCIASGIIFYISSKCNLHISKSSIRNISGVSEVSINKSFKKLEHLELIPRAILSKY